MVLIRREMVIIIDHWVERSYENVVREFKEELGLDITIDTYITCLENIYTVDHEQTHEIVQLYAV